MISFLQQRAPRRRGQVAIFLLMLLTALSFVLLWNVDLHRIVTTKTRSQTAGDASALAAARWQGIGLNLVGELNLLHALALSSPDAAGRAAASDAITGIQARVLFTAPLTALVAAQVAAKNNGMYADDPAFNGGMAAYIGDLETRNASGWMPVPPYADAWTDYIGMLKTIARDGIAAATPPYYYGDNIAGNHILLDRDLYDAIATRDWCWFFLHYPRLLPDYDNYTYWQRQFGPLPVVHVPSFNSGYLPLWLRPVSVPLDTLVSDTDLLAAAGREGVDMTGFVPTTNVMRAVETWYVYDRSWWGPWTLMATDGPDPFPATGPVRPEYDYAGADAYFSVHAIVNRLTPGLDGGAVTNALTWSAAAKPFGALGPDTARTTPTRFDLVLPAFAEARLIPVDASYDSGNGSDDLDWLRHKNDHLPVYVQSGATLAGCWYCQQLATWENQTFRQAGINWLAINSHLCTVPSGPGGGGGGRGGGRRHGH